MIKGTLSFWTKLVVFTAVLLSLSTRVEVQERKGDRDRDDDRHEHGDHGERIRVPSGQFVTPTALEDSVQQFLNPQLPDYPNFIAGEAVRSELSPDGQTLAIITAGQNSLRKMDGTTDTANSTQYIFLYDVAGVNRARPVLAQVIKQRNAHV